jgi:hypothetical protein
MGGLFRQRASNTPVCPQQYDVTFDRARVSLPAEAVEKDNLHDHFIPDFLLHQSIKKYA